MTHIFVKASNGAIKQLRHVLALVCSTAMPAKKASTCAASINMSCTQNPQVLLTGSNDFDKYALINPTTAHVQQTTVQARLVDRKSQSISICLAKDVVRL